MKVILQRIKKDLPFTEYGSARIELHGDKVQSHLHYSCDPHSAFRGMQVLAEAFNLEIEFEIEETVK